LLVVLGGITALRFLGSLFSGQTRMPGLLLLIGLVLGSIMEIVALARVWPLMLPSAPLRSPSSSAPCRSSRSEGNSGSQGISTWAIADDSPQLAKTAVRIIAAGLEFPEGPVALADGSVLVTEIAAGTLARVSPNV
jgi:glucose/arabinose dehydrogenase